MNESYVTVVGRLTADPVLRHTTQGKPFATFRLASTVRRWDARQGAYVDGATNFVSVACFNALAANVVASATKGQPVIVYGRLRVNQWTPAEGRSTSSVEIDAYHVGHDLSWGQTSFAKVARAQFDPHDRLAGPEVQESLHGVEAVPGEPAAVGPGGGLHVVGDADEPAPIDDEPEPADDDRPFDVEAADPLTDPYVVARAG